MATIKTKSNTAINSTPQLASIWEATWLHFGRVWRARLEPNWHSIVAGGKAKHLCVQYEYIYTYIYIYMYRYTHVYICIYLMAAPTSPQALGLWELRPKTSPKSSSSQSVLRLEKCASMDSLQIAMTVQTILVGLLRRSTIVETSQGLGLWELRPKTSPKSSQNRSKIDQKSTKNRSKIDLGGSWGRSGGVLGLILGDLGT